MNKTTPSRKRRLVYAMKLRTAAVIASSFVGTVLAQPVLISPPVAPSERGPAPSSSEGTESDATPGIGGVSPSRDPFRWRRLNFRPRLAYQVLYGTGISAQVGDQKKTIVQTISPGMTIEVGDFWVLDYSPSVRIYSDSSFKNSVNHSASLTGRTSYEDWTFGLGASASISSDPIAETGTQTDQKSVSISANAGRQLNADLSVDVSGSMSMRLAEKFTSSRSYSTMTSLRQQVGQGIGIGLGIGGGYEDVDVGTDMTFERLQAELQWIVVKKLTLSLNAGPEVRQFVGSDKGSTISPVFGGSLNYQASKTTSLNLNASRSIGSSYFENQITETTSVTAGLNQRFLQRYNLGLSGGYSFGKYRSTAKGTPSGREDSNRFFSVSLGTRVLTRGSASIFYSISDNSSDTQQFTYSSNQAGAQISYSY